MIATPTCGRAWEDATSPRALDLAREFEDRWRRSEGGRRPDPLDFLPDDPEDGRPGRFLALLRVDLALRRDRGEEIRPESYRDRYPWLGEDVLVALIYEEFCLREEAGEGPEPAAYYGRFPDLTARLREVLEIHGLVAESRRSGSHRPARRAAEAPFPEPSQTIGGYLLVEELGRGSFARVFLARERQLADRPVALKVSRTGSREPQTLARLQHTNIVPVHSYRVDPTTGLHVLCMPYLGRVTLARLLDDPALRAAKSGDDLVATLDRLVAPRGEGEGAGRQSAREALSRRSYPRAIAWWGARMAEALRHAHDRGVLHRDVKPSNILIASDGTPMLLDFNLAREAEGGGEGAAKLGGTLAYMSPEHLEALIQGRDAGVDHRADLYAMGLVLAEMLGIKPLPASSPADSPTRLLGLRRAGPPELVAGPAPVPAALAAVIRRCLAPDPEGRYASAGDLALDLQAVADDAPLRIAREPFPARSSRWLRNNLARLAVLALVAIGTSAYGVARFRARVLALRHEAEARGLVRDGLRSASAGEFRAAALLFASAAERAGARPELAEVRGEALRRREAAEADGEARDRADAFFGRAERLRFALLGFVGDQAAASGDLVDALRPFGVLTEAGWDGGPAATRLDAERRSRLIREVDDLLYFWVVAAALAPADPATRRERSIIAVAYCDRALAFSEHRGPWIALRRWWEDRPGRDRPAPALPRAALGSRADACFRWYLLGTLGAGREPALAWLERAAKLEPQNYWHRFALAFERARGDELDLARPHYDAAIAVRPDFPWAWKNRALMACRQGDWSSAFDDLDRALSACRAPVDVARVRLEIGRARQRLGEFRAARLQYDAAEAADPTGLVASDARRDRARLEADSGAVDLALTLYDALIAADPGDWRSRRGRANIALRRGRPGDALGDLDILIDRGPGRQRASFLADRAAARLALGRPVAASVDAALAHSIRPSAATARLRDRAKLAMGGDLDGWPESPEVYDDLPHGGAVLVADLKAAADRVATAMARGPTRPDLRLRRAVLLSASGDHAGALAQADQAVAGAPGSTEAKLIRARVRRRAGRLDAASADVAEALALEPEDPRSMELRGAIRAGRGDVAGGYRDLAVAWARGAVSARGPSMAEALGGLGRHAEAADLWGRLVEDDPSDVRALLGLAIARRHLGQWDRSLAALEEAAAATGPRSPRIGRITLEYAACLPARPGHLPRVLALARRWVGGRLSTQAESRGVKPGASGFEAPAALSTP